MILPEVAPIASISSIYPIDLWRTQHQRIHYLIPLACSLTMIFSIHSHYHLKAFMLLRQGVSLRTVCIRRLVRIGRQGLRLLRCFCFCGEHACLSAAYRSLLRPCLYVCLGCSLLAARPVRICVLPMCTCATCEQADACWCGQECDICGSERMARPVARYM